MKKHYLSFLLIFISFILHAQAPQGMNYQAVARNSSGDPLTNQHIGLQFIIHDGSTSGTVEYTETDTATTNEFGLFTVVVGSGTAVMGNFAGIAWGDSTKFLEVRMDPTGGTTYASYGNSQLQSVPYALSSGQWAANGINIYSVNSSFGYVGIGRNQPYHKLDVFGDDFAVGANAFSTIYMRAGGADSMFMLYTGGIWELNIRDNGVDYDIPDNFFEPFSSNVTSCGDPSYLWTAVYSTNGTIQTSDERMKKNIHDLNMGLNAVMQLRPVSYDWKDGTGGDNIGFIAQEVEKIVPQAVVHDHITPEQIAAVKANHKQVPEITDPYAMKYSELIPVLTKAIQEQQHMIEQQQQKMEQMQQQIDALKNK